MLAASLWWNSYRRLLLKFTNFVDYGRQWIYALYGIMGEWRTSQHILLSLFFCVTHFLVSTNLSLIVSVTYYLISTQLTIGSLSFQTNPQQPCPALCAASRSRTSGWWIATCGSTREKNPSSVRCASNASTWRVVLPHTCLSIWTCSLNSHMLVHMNL